LRISSSNCGAIATLSRFLHSATLPGGLLGSHTKRNPTNGERVMTISSLQSREQITAISVEITDADFNRIEVIGDLIRHTEIVDAACPEATLARTSLSETHAA
jgi:hypothetical protein